MDVFHSFFLTFVCYGLPFAEKTIFKPSDMSVFSTLSINGRLFVCRRDQLDSLVCYKLHLHEKLAY